MLVRFCVKMYDKSIPNFVCESVTNMRKLVLLRKTMYELFAETFSAQL